MAGPNDLFGWELTHLPQASLDRAQSAWKHEHYGQMLSLGLVKRRKKPGKKNPVAFMKSCLDRMPSPLSRNNIFALVGAQGQERDIV